MRILLVNKFYFRAGGVESYLFNLKELLEKQGHEVAIFSMQDNRNEQTIYSKYFIKNVDFNIGGFKRVATGLKSIYSFEARRKISKLLNDFKPDIVHLNSIGFQLTSSIIGPIKKQKIPIVQTMHEYKLICPNQRLFNLKTNEICEKCKAHKYYQPVLTSCLKSSRLAGLLAGVEAYLSESILKFSKKVDLFISPSMFLKNKCHAWGIPKDKIKHLYNFVDLKNFKPDYQRGDYILYFGRFSEEKGLLNVAKAAEELSGVNFKLVGTGPVEKELKEYIKEHDLKNLELVGFKKGKDLDNLIKNCSLTIIPSIWYENNPLAVIESFGWGKPVIGSNLGGIPEMVKDGETGFIYQYDDVGNLVDVITDALSSDELAKIGRNGRRFVENECLDKVYYKKLIGVYTKLINT